MLEMAETIDIEIQNIEGHFTELIRYMDSDEDINALTTALNNVQSVQYHREKVV